MIIVLQTNAETRQKLIHDAVLTRRCEDAQDIAALCAERAFVRLKIADKTKT